MSPVRNLASATLLLTLVMLLGGCSSPAPTPPGSSVDAQPEDSAPAEGSWRQSLPSEPGYAWDTARYVGQDPIGVDLTVEGPWTLRAAEGWPVTTTEIVEPSAVPGIDAFDGFDYVLKASEGGIDHYYPRQVTDEWMLQLGKITVSGADVTAEPYGDPLKFWPVDFEVGESFVVADGGSFRIDATVLAQSTAIVPAGEIDDAYLLRFEYTPLAEGAIEGTNYYILSPSVGVVALFHASEGDEASGFTALDSENVLVTLPEKR